mmetsp:Transcript_8508/g.53160  ORF Transcript_8508/g.53160 Transcript_8508/m.53160 type:complete len:239 (-) Transcript_8508:3113-3829(-)
MASYRHVSSHTSRHRFVHACGCARSGGGTYDVATGMHMHGPRDERSRAERARFFGVVPRLRWQSIRVRGSLSSTPTCAHVDARRVHVHPSLHSCTTLVPQGWCGCVKVVGPVVQTCARPSDGGCKHTALVQLVVASHVVGQSTWHACGSTGSQPQHACFHDARHVFVRRPRRVSRRRRRRHPTCVSCTCVGMASRQESGALGRSAGALSRSQASVRGAEQPCRAFLVRPTSRRGPAWR